MAHSKSKRRLIGLAPRPLIILAAELGSVCPIQDINDQAANGGGPREWISRLRPLLDKRNSSSFHALFDAQYYVRSNPDVRDGRWTPFLHFLLWGGFEGRKPHPLFDPAWYLERYPDVELSRLNPLQHYVGFGSREGRSPGPLFDAAWYLAAYPDVKAAGADPLLHFLKDGAAEGRQPHPLFDSRWYARHYPQVTESGLNPLVHYATEGGTQGLKPNRGFNAKYYALQYPASVAKGTNPLAHYVTGMERGDYDPHPGYPRPDRRRSQPAGRREKALVLTRSRSAHKNPQTWQNSNRASTIPVFVVYGSSNVPFIESELIPSLTAQHCGAKIQLHTLNYKNSLALLSAEAKAYSAGALAEVTDWSSEREDRHIGFGEAVNYLFERVSPESCFLLVNPDAMPMPGCIDRLLTTYHERSAGLVEARQWPSEHPKEYDSQTGWTPWASGSFVLIASEAFRRLGGFDPLYFLYNEDVDLSWRAWLHGIPVVYEPRAMCAHFTGLLSYRPTRFYYEHFFSIRNFLLISYKFFGESGERAAWEWIEEARLSSAFRAKVEQDYLQLRNEVRRVESSNAYHADKVKILGLNLYHQLRQV